VDATGKLRLLGEQSGFDLAGARDGAPSADCRARDPFVYNALLPGGGALRQLKVLLDNACPNDCAYCAQRAGRDTPRDRFSPEELAKLFDALIRADRVDALFLSSGLGGNAVRTMDRMLAAAELVRRGGFAGFIHLKILPGAELAQVERAAQLAQRLSINLEVPDDARLQALSGRKSLQGDILQRLEWIARVVVGRRALARSHTTQFVVGAAGESDAEILAVAERLYRDLGLGRAYYSAFAPVPGTPLEHHPPAAPLRQHRLYQADFLMRRYGFSGREIPMDADGRLDLDEDPKTLWARRHPEHFPVDVVRADREELLRVPGLGPLSVSRILAARGSGGIRDLAQLLRITSRARQSAPYLVFGGRRPAGQLPLALR
jgi:predicted DNA-binding helix-hairpin-helix protein